MTTDRKIALYHPYRIKGLTVIRLLESEFNCLEIRNWEDLEESDAEIVIILFPEILSPEVSTDKMKLMIEGLRANVILVHYANTFRWIFGENISYLKNPSPERLKMKLRVLNTFPRLERSKGR